MTELIDYDVNHFDFAIGNFKGLRTPIPSPASNLHGVELSVPLSDPM